MMIMINCTKKRKIIEINKKRLQALLERSRVKIITTQGIFELRWISSNNKLRDNTTKIRRHLKKLANYSALC